MMYVYDDGGRAAAGYKGKAGDCACRALAIATGMSYETCYALVDGFSALEKPRAKGKRSSAGGGVYRETFGKILEALGYVWVPTMGFGTGCRVHLRADELPKGRIIVRLSRHYAAVVDGVLHDNHDSSRGGTRCVYGYWTPKK